MFFVILLLVRLKLWVYTDESKAGGLLSFPPIIKHKVFAVASLIDL